MFIWNTLTFNYFFFFVNQKDRFDAKEKIPDLILGQWSESSCQINPNSFISITDIWLISTGHGYTLVSAAGRVKGNRRLIPGGRKYPYFSSLSKFPMKAQLPQTVANLFWCAVRYLVNLLVLLHANVNSFSLLMVKSLKNRRKNH